uniref:Uncharacterized protein n=1 Tax=Panagrolaimus sp. PS1159 TaxID=55785 RepID=A0AC35G9J8_9BILA
MRAFIFFSFLLLGIFIAKSNGATYKFLNTLCVQLKATPFLGSPFDSVKDAMEACVDRPSCVGFQKISENEFCTLRSLTGYVLNKTSEDYFLLDTSNGTTFPKQPQSFDAAILNGIYRYGECPMGFNIDGTMCVGGDIVTADMCSAYQSYMTPEYNGTHCLVLQKQKVIDSWSN